MEPPLDPPDPDAVTGLCDACGRFQAVRWVDEDQRFTACEDCPNARVCEDCGERLATVWSCGGSLICDLCAEDADECPNCQRPL